MPFPSTQTTKKTQPIQADGYNCGVYVLFSIQDMVITQRNRQWFVADVFTTKTKDKKEAWKTAIQEKKPMVIPASYKIGTCFVK
jgi:Ulp1 family protease